MILVQAPGMDRAESLAEARRAVLPSLPAAREASQALPAEPLLRQARRCRVLWGLVDTRTAFHCRTGPRCPAHPLLRQARRCGAS